jgi:hypothetical protein
MATITISTPSEKLVVSQNGTAENKPQPASGAINKLLEANTPLAVWLIFLAIGGGILALYYARIGYLPEIEWKAALVYLFIGSVVGGVIGLLLTMSLYLPGVIWAETIVFDPCLEFSYTAPAGEQQSGKTPATEVCIRSIFRYLGVPFLLVLLLSHTALLSGQFLYWVFAGGLLLLTFMVMRILFRYRLLPDDSPTRLSSYVWSNLKSDLKYLLRRPITALKILLNGTKPEDRRIVTLADRHVFKLSSAFTLAVLLNQISMYVIYRLSGSPAKSWTFVILTLICTGGVWITGHIVALRHRDHARQAVLVSIVAAGVLLFAADNFSSLSVKLMNNFGIGYYQRVNLLMTDHGGDIARDLGVQSCGKLQLCNVEILSKVGDQYYLRVGDQAHLTLPKVDVVAIRPLN